MILSNDHETERTTEDSDNSLGALQKFQIIIGIIVSVATVTIGWQTYELSAKTNENNLQLKRIEQQLAQTRLGFERIRDVYDRTEKYLSSEKQNQARGRVLVVLINSLPDTQLRTELLTVVTESAQLNSIAAKASDLSAGVNSSEPIIPSDPSFSGQLSLRVNNDAFTLTTTGDFSFKDSKGVSWPVPKGTVVSGAAVPRTAWSIVGSPLTSNYAISLVLLEHYSTIRTRPVSEVHTMFYESLIKAGVSKMKAQLLYNSVKSFGPRWNNK